MASKTVDIKIGSKFDGSGFSSAMRSLRGLTKGATDIKTAFSAGFSAVSRVVQGLAAAISSSFRFESQTRHFKMLVGGIDEARAHMADLKALGDTPPFSLDQFAAASRELMVMTQGALGYKKSLEMIGDAAAATGRPIETLSQSVGYLYASIRDGQPLSRAVMQLRRMGVITPEVAKKLQDMQDVGRSGVEIWAEVEASLQRYKGAMAETEQTGEGLVKAISTRWDNIVRAFGDAFADTAKGGMKEVLDAAKRIEEDGSIQTWVEEALDYMGRFAEGAKTILAPVADIVGGIWKTLRGGYESMGQAVGNVVGTISGGGGIVDALKSGAQGFKQGWVDAFDSDGAQAEYNERRRQEFGRRRREREAREAQREAEEEQRKIDALKEGDRKREAAAAEKAAAEREKAEVAAMQAAAKERDRLDRELHQKRMADLNAEMEAQRDAASAMQSVASAAQSEFERAFAMYRDPSRAAAEIAEERDRASDLKQLHRDASRYGGKWRIDELSALMAAGDSQGVQSRLEDWRKSRSFTPEVEAMVRASAAEQTQTTAEDELRKLNDKTGELAQKLETLAQSRDSKLDGIERNTNQLANKLDELLTVKG